MRVSSSSGSEEDTTSTCSSEYQTAIKEGGAISLPDTDNYETADGRDGAISMSVTDNLISSFSALTLSRPSLKECFNYSGILIDCVMLDRQITDAADISDIAKKLTQCRDLLPYFGLEEYEKEEVEAAGDLSENKRRLLTMWTKKYGPRATYRRVSIWTISFNVLVNGFFEMKTHRLEVVNPPKGKRTCRGGATIDPKGVTPAQRLT